MNAAQVATRSPSLTPSAQLRATVEQAHRFLQALARQERPDWRNCPKAALHWLEDRRLVQAVTNQNGTEYRLTTQGWRILSSSRAG